jgi:hypothetical protein
MNDATNLWVARQAGTVQRMLVAKYAKRMPA